MTDNQGNGAKIQHSTGTTTTGDLAVFDANGNVIDGGTAGKDYNFSFTGCTIPPELMHNASQLSTLRQAQHQHSQLFQMRSMSLNALRMVVLYILISPLTLHSKGLLVADLDIR